ncbi:MAG TPA: O-antigen ligase family protein, partial [Microcella sp.]|nr:O-antigen ligase family protein [Microcella sp.]
MSWLREKRVALASLTVFTLLAGDFWRNLLSWWGWAIIAVALLIAWIVVTARTRVDPRRLPIALAAFLLLTALSTAWSAYPLTTALAVLTTIATVFVGVVMAATISLEQFVRAAGVALRWLIGLSLFFELVVAAVIRAPVFPFFTDYDEPVPAAFFWSRAELFSVLDGGRIQGIVGNANLLATAAALGLIVFGVQLADRRVPVVTAWFWGGMSTLTLLLTQSATVTVALAGCAFTLGVVVLARRLDRQRRRLLYAGTVAGGVVATVTAIALRESVLGLLG